MSLIFTSPLTRCLETARVFKATCGFQGRLIADDWLLETQGGNHHCNERLSSNEIEANEDIEFRCRFTNSEIQLMTSQPRETVAKTRDRA